MKHLLLTTIAAVVLVGCGPSIHEAVEAGNIEAVKQAIAAGKDVNSEDECCGVTPLHYATRWGRKEIAELLIAKGADVNAKAKYGDTPLHGAIYANGTYLEETGRKEMIELLIAKGADVNAKDEGGKTPLHFATGYGRNEIVELLIAKGADVNAKNNRGGTPLDKTIGYPKLADLLRKHGGKRGAELIAEGK